MVSSLFISNVYIQTCIFVITSSILIPLTKPLVDKFIKTPDRPMNSFSLIGKNGIVISSINGIESTGQVKVKGEIWSAKSKNDSIIEEGTEIEVLEIDGVKLLVTPLK